MIEIATNPLFLWGCLAGLLLMGLAWLKFSKSSEHEAEVDRLTDQKKKLDADIKRIRGVVTGHESANAALVDQKAKAELALVEMREKFESQEVDVSALEDECDRLKSNLAIDRTKLEKLRHMSIDARLTRIKGIGPKVEESLNKIGIRSIFDVAEMPQDKLAEAMEEANVPGRLGNPKAIQKQAKSLAAKLEKSIAG